MIEKALGLPADVVMLDCEDSVPLAEKDEARGRVAAALVGKDWGGRVRAVRVNGMDTPFCYRDIVEVVERAGARLDVIVLPKVCEPCEVRAVDLLLSQIEARVGLPVGRIGIEAGIETAEGMLRAGEIAFASRRLEALVFGIADYSASLRMMVKGVSGHGDAEEFFGGDRFHHALATIAVAARAAGLSAIDAPFGDFRDPAGLRRSALRAAGLGFDGKWVIHPDQIGVVNEVFTPDPEDVARMRRVIEAAEEARRAGLGSVSLDGKMVDGATVRLARSVCARADLLAGRT